MNKHYLYSIDLVPPSTIIHGMSVFVIAKSKKQIRQYYCGAVRDIYMRQSIEPENLLPAQIEKDFRK